MATFLQILGSNLFVLWAIGKILGNKVLEIIPTPYGELYLQNNLVLPVVGLSLVVIAQVLKLSQRNRHRERNLRQTSVFTQTSRDHYSQRTDKSTYQKNQKVSNKNPNSKKSYSKAQQKHIVESASYKSEDHKALALKVDWSPLSGGGANFKTKTLHTESDTRLIIKSSRGNKLFSLFFIGMGLGIPGIIGFTEFKAHGLDWSLLFPLLIGSVFTGVGFLMMFYPKPRYIDKQVGWFWAGKSSPNGERELRESKISSPINDLVAIQIISEQISGKNGYYTSWELNLVDENAKRYNVMDHGKKDSLINDAYTISEFLSIPVWNNS